jgi:WD40 repeat protein/DNA-binding SARP family transcriptional activator
MQLLSLSLLGSFGVAWDERPLHFETNTARALLVYLAIEANRPIARTQLAELFWPEQSAIASSNNLRQTLRRMRRAIPDPPGADAVLNINKTTLQFKPDLAMCDVVQFEDLLATCALHAHTNLVSCPACIQRMQEATALYRGELLSGLPQTNSHLFEEWLLFKREQLHRQALEALNVLTLRYEATGQYEAMRQSAARQLELEAWREEAHAQLMRALAFGGDRTAALAQFDAFRQLLRSELGIEPTLELRALAEHIRNGTLERPRPMSLPTQMPTQTTSADTVATQWHTIPESGPLFGREVELAQMNTWLVQDRSRLVWMLGMGGVGKTSLAAHAATSAAPHFDVVVWRSLLNAPPIEEVLRAAVQVLSRQHMADFPATLDEQLALMLDLLQHTRCLLVLDNFESILQSGERGDFRAGYEGYNQLIQLLATNRHASCLLITSREQPGQTARWNGNVGVHMLRLMGLAPDAGREMLAAYQLGGVLGVPGNEQANASTLVQRYSGNPLALKLVAQTVQELFMGSIGDFLSTEAPIFDDVRTVLDEQFDRLSPLQLEIMMWLAVAREPTTTAGLREQLLYPPAPRELLEALRTLQHRSLVEQVDAGGAAALTLQNVIMEYVTDKLVDASCRDIEQAQFATLNRHALLQARTKEYVLQSQIRLILKPIAERLLSALGKEVMEDCFQRILVQLRALPRQSPSYAAGNILNLLLHLGFDTTRYDFSELSVWQVDLRDASFSTLNFRNANLANDTFIQAIDVGSVKYGESGQMLVAGMEGSDLCLWRIADGQLQSAFRTPSRGGLPIVFNDDGRMLANCGLDHRIRVWSAESGALLQTLEGHTDQLFNPTFSRDGKQLACGGRDGSVFVWDVHSGRAIHVISVVDSSDLITGLAFNPDGTMLVGGGSRHDLWMWDLQSNAQLVKKLHGHVREIECCAFSPDGTCVVSGAHDGVIRVWNVATGACVHELSGHSQVVRTLSFHPDGQILASGSADRTALLWNVSSGQAIHTLIGHAHEVTTLSFNTDGTVLASGSADKTVRRWSVRTGQTLEILNSYAKMVDTVQWSPVAALLASGGADGVLRLWNTSDNTLRQLHRRPLTRVQCVAFSPDGRWLASAQADTVQVWDVSSGKPIGVLRGHAGTVNSVAFSSDGTWLASGSSDKTIRLWSVDLKQPGLIGQRMSVLSGHEDVVISIAFNPDGRMLLSGSLDHTARLWDVGDCRQISVLQGHTSALYGTTFTPDGKWALANSWNYQVYAWNVVTAQRIGMHITDLIRARGIAFSPDGQTIGCVTRAQSIELRNFCTGELRCVLRGHEMTIRSINFNCDGSLLASADWNGDIRLWDTTIGECVSELRAPGPYAGMDITGAMGINAAQKTALRALGARSDG